MVPYADPEQAMQASKKACEEARHGYERAAFFSGLPTLIGSLGLFLMAMFPGQGTTAKDAVYGVGGALLAAGLTWVRRLEALQVLQNAENRLVIDRHNWLAWEAAKKRTAEVARFTHAFSPPANGG